MEQLEHNKNKETDEDKQNNIREQSNVTSNSMVPFRIQTVPSMPITYNRIPNVHQMDQMNSPLPPLSSLLHPNDLLYSTNSNYSNTTYATLHPTLSLYNTVFPFANAPSSSNTPYLPVQNVTTQYPQLNPMPTYQPNSGTEQLHNIHQMSNITFMTTPNPFNPSQSFPMPPLQPYPSFTQPNLMIPPMYPSTTVGLNFSQTSHQHFGEPIQPRSFSTSTSTTMLPYPSFGQSQSSPASASIPTSSVTQQKASKQEEKLKPSRLDRHSSSLEALLVLSEETESQPIDDRSSPMKKSRKRQKLAEDDTYGIKPSTPTVIPDGIEHSQIQSTQVSNINTKFALEEQPSMSQRKAYAYEKRWMNPAPLVVALRDTEESPKVKSGSVSVRLVNENGVDVTSKNIIESEDGKLKKQFDEDLKARFFLRLLKTSATKLWRLHFHVEFKEHGSPKAKTEIIVSNPFVVMTSGKKKTVETQNTKDGDTPPGQEESIDTVVNPVPEDTKS